MATQTQDEPAVLTPAITQGPCAMWAKGADALLAAATACDAR